MGSNEMAGGALHGRHVEGPPQVPDILSADGFGQGSIQNMIPINLAEGIKTGMKRDGHRR